MDSLSEKYGGYTPELNEVHEKLMEKILEDEEVITQQHRKFIDDNQDMDQQASKLLNDVQQTGSDLGEYAIALDKILLKKIQDTLKVRDKLHAFYKDLKTEEVMSQLFEETQQNE